jgi:CubicO group peptidase (beta-lactamase class C family)
MGQLEIQAEASEVGMDPARLALLEPRLRGFIDRGLMPGWLLLISRAGKIVHLSRAGYKDLERQEPIGSDTIWRLMSMTKPITSVAAMMLYEQGLLSLTDPVSRFIPAFDGMRVYAGGSPDRPMSVPAFEPVTIWHLLTHTAGMTQAFVHRHPCDEMLRNRGFGFTNPPGMTLEQAVERWASVPLLFQPGTDWNYSLATDVLSRVIELVTHSPLDQALRDLLFEPLGMEDTGFWLPADRRNRLAQLYMGLPGGIGAAHEEMALVPQERPTFMSGGSGLVGTAGDYHRFLRMLARKGELEGKRLLTRRTVEYMTRNHLPGGVDLESFSRPLFADVPMRGVGYGLGFSVVQDPVRHRSVSSAGEYGWGGVASTLFWVDPSEELEILFMSQIIPTPAVQLRSALHPLIYYSIVD